MNSSYIRILHTEISVKIFAYQYYNVTTDANVCICMETDGEVAPRQSCLFCIDESVYIALLIISH